jgi:alanine transaminase
VNGLNAIDGMTCNPSEGAMYAFPRVEFPPKALDEAAALEQTPDSMYALSLLEETGICVVPASGFGQKGERVTDFFFPALYLHELKAIWMLVTLEGRIGFRTTFLPPEDELNEAIVEFKRHHELFCEKYA